MKEGDLVEWLFDFLEWAGGFACRWRRLIACDGPGIHDLAVFIGYGAYIAWQNRIRKGKPDKLSGFFS